MKFYVIGVIQVDKLILKDVQLTVANDDNYFVFEDVVLEVWAV